ncbi:MAG: RNA methyltransferase [Bacillota bacterium]|nr:RNA methyltransferase [Bacillota bacterium]
MELIQSRDNLLIKEIKKLNEKKYRDALGKFFIEGYRFVEEAFLAGARVEKILISQRYLERFEETVLSTYNVQRFLIKDNLFESLCGTETPQGVAAVIEKEKHEISFQKGTFVLLDRLQDPGNVGTIIRTSHAAGVRGIIYTTGTVDPYNDKCLRSTMGSIFYIPIIEDKNLNLVNKLRDDGFKLVVSSLDTEEDFFSREYGDKIIIAVGNEGKGISKEVSALADIKVKIPMPGGAESLNASVAASIMIYEVLRQKIK